MKISFYENVAKNTFIKGIKEPYHSFLTHFELNDIEDCLNKCSRHDNHEHHKNFGNNNFGNNNFGNRFRQNNNNNNQAIRQNYQSTPMSISTRNTNRPGDNQTKLTCNNIFRSTGTSNFVTEELHHQEDHQNLVAQENRYFVAQENDYQEEQPQNLVDEMAAIDDTENFQLDPIVSGET